MTNSVQNLIEDLEALRGETVRVFGQPTTLNQGNEYLLRDAVAMLEELRGYEADMMMEKLDYENIARIEAEIERTQEEIEALEYDVEIGRLDLTDHEVEECYKERMELLEIELENLQAELDEAQEDYKYVEAESVDEYIEYLEDCHGLTEKYSDNTYNMSGNITNDYYIHGYECHDGYFYVQMAFHRYGDVRCNYTEDVLFRFDDEWQAHEIISDAGYESFTIEIEDEEYMLDVRAEWEEIMVYRIDSERCCEDVFTIYGCFTEDEAKEKIIEELGLDIEKLEA